MPDSPEAPRRAVVPAGPYQSTASSFRPGDSIPPSAPPYPTAAAVESVSPYMPRKIVRRSLRYSTAEGVFAEIVGAFSAGAVLTAWALMVGASPMVVGMLGAFPFLSQPMQFSAAWLTHRYGHRRVAIVAVGLSRQVAWPLVALPFLPLAQSTQQTVLIAITAFSGILGVIGNNAWTAWMGDLVPRAVRGRFFGRRTSVVTVGATLAALAAGLVIDFARPLGRVEYALSALALLSCLAGAATTYLMLQQHDPSSRRQWERLDFKAAVLPLRDPVARRFLAYQVAWNGAVGISASFFVIHMIQTLKMGFVLIALHGGAAAFVRYVMTPVWGRILDRVGARPILIFCSFGLPLCPFLWLFVREDFLWPLVLDVLVSGTLWSGHGLAAFSLPLSVAPKKGRSFYLAAFATAGGLAFTAATVVGGLIAKSVPPHYLVLGQPMVAMQAVFFTSSMCRIVAATLSLRIVEMGSRPVRDVARLLVGDAIELRERFTRLLPVSIRRS